MGECFGVVVVVVGGCLGEGDVRVVGVEGCEAAVGVLARLRFWRGLGSGKAEVLARLRFWRRPYS